MNGQVMPNPWVNWCMSGWLGGCTLDAFSDGRWVWGLLLAFLSLGSGFSAVIIWKLEKENAPPNSPG